MVMAHSNRSLQHRNGLCYGRRDKQRLCLSRGDATCHSARYWCHECRGHGCSTGIPPCAPGLYRESSSRRRRSCLPCLRYQGPPLAVGSSLILPPRLLLIYSVAFHSSEAGPGHRHSAFRPVHPGSIVSPVLVDVEAVCHVCATRGPPSCRIS